MKNIVIKVICIAAAVGTLLQQTVAQTTPRETKNDEQVVRIAASTFEFRPSEISVKKGIPVTFELVSDDRPHGFKLPEFHLRADIKPGFIQKVRFIPDKVGTFTFVCDVFCGEGHEEMSGILRVIEN